MINKKFTNNTRVHSSVLFMGNGDVVAGNNTQLRAYTVIEMDKGTFVIGDNSVIGYNSFIQCTGRITIGRGSLLGPHCSFIASSHPVNNQPLISQPMIRGEIKIGNNVWIGANCTINIGITIGDNAIIGANSFVNKDVPANTVWAGSPIRFIKNR